MPSRPAIRSSYRPNTIAIGISLLAGGILYASTNAVDGSGTEPPDEGLVSFGSSLTPVMSISAPQTHDSPGPRPNPIAGTGDDSKSAHVRKPCAEGRTALMMNMFMLEKGRARIAALSGYNVNFHKHERIDGCMQDAQVVSMDVRHEPFSVYMKWVKGGDRGRQVLFVPSKHDGKAIVRLGGLKGRFIPPVHIEPDSSQALSESRYPLTKAGIVPVVDLVLAYRKDDIEKRTGIKSVMYDDEEIDGRKVYTFRVEYPSCEISPRYRLSISYLDQETMLLVRLRNYTWAKDVAGLTPEELAEQTMVEDYAFTELEFAAETKLAELFAKKKL